MDLLDVVNRTHAPEPWAEGDNIPWDEPGFSERMLREHLSQAHDAASRRAEIIDAHVDWIHRELLRERPARILDLGCGPGLYTERLATLRHTCAGIDFSPASIAYARESAHASGSACTYQHADIRTAEYGGSYSLVTLLFGELNVFRSAHARRILGKAREALCDDGLLLLEVHPWAVVRAMGDEPATWRAVASGLFSDRPHLRLDESCWHAEQRAATRRHYVVDGETGEVTRYAQSMQAYTDAEYHELLGMAGFRVTSTIASLAGADEPGELFVLVAEPVGSKP